MSNKNIIAYIIGAIGTVFWLVYQLNADITRIDTTQKMHMESDKRFAKSVRDADSSGP